METQLLAIPAPVGTMILHTAALIAGIGYILMFGSPVAEAICYNKLVDLHNPLLNVQHITANIPLLRYRSVLYLVNFLGYVLGGLGCLCLVKACK